MSLGKLSNENPIRMQVKLIDKDNGIEMIAADNVIKKHGDIITGKQNNSLREKELFGVNSFLSEKRGSGSYRYHTLRVLTKYIDAGLAGIQLSSGQKYYDEREVVARGILQGFGTHEIDAEHFLVQVSYEAFDEELSPKQMKERLSHIKKNHTQSLKENKAYFSFLFSKDSIEASLSNFRVQLEHFHRRLPKSAVHPAALRPFQVLMRKLEKKLANLEEKWVLLNNLDVSKEENRIVFNKAFDSVNRGISSLSGMMWQGRNAVQQVQNFNRQMKAHIKTTKGFSKTERFFEQSMTALKEGNLHSAKYKYFGKQVQKFQNKLNRLRQVVSGKKLIQPHEVGHLILEVESARRDVLEAFERSKSKKEVFAALKEVIESSKDNRSARLLSHSLNPVTNLKAVRAGRSLSIKGQVTIEPVFTAKSTLKGWNISYENLGQKPFTATFVMKGHGKYAGKAGRRYGFESMATMPLDKATQFIGVGRDHGTTADVGKELQLAIRGSKLSKTIRLPADEKIVISLSTFRSDKNRRGGQSNYFSERYVLSKKAEKAQKVKYV